MTNIDAPTADRTPQTRVARVLTDGLAPANLVIASLLVIGTASTASWSGFGWGLLAATFAGIIPLAIILRGVHQGRLSDKHIGRREQRTSPLLASIGSVVIGTVLLLILGAPRPVSALIVAMLVVLLVTVPITLRWKVSVHAAVATAVVVVLVITFGAWLLVAAVLAAAVGWSRVVLRDHTTAQVLVGALLGGVVAGVIFGALS